MATYDVVVKRIRGLANDTTAALIQAYIETLDDTTNTLLSTHIVGDNNFITAFIIHKNA
jgi:hypothetical protein